MVTEQTFFQDKNVLVTSARVAIRGTTYATANITSVTIWEEPRRLIFLISGLFMLPLGLACTSVFHVKETGIPFSIVGACLLLYYFLKKPKYWVRIATSGVESNASYSNDRTWTEQVVSAINAAIVSRG